MSVVWNFNAVFVKIVSISRVKSYLDTGNVAHLERYNSINSIEY